MGLNNLLTPRRNALGLCAGIVAMLWLAMQIIVIATHWGAPQYSDAANYLQFASEAVAANAIYPTATQIYNAWVANTGYINFLVLNLYAFGTTDFVPVEQLLLNCLLLWSVRELTRRFGSEAAANVAVIIFCLLPSNIYNVQTRMSDLFCCALFMWSIVLMRRKAGWLLLAGAVAAVANWARPVGMVFWPSVMLGALLICRKERLGWGKIGRLTLSYAVGVALVGGAIMISTDASCGVPLHGSTTKGTNMIMGCNDRARGEYDDSVFQPGECGYIDPALGLNAVERDQELTRRSVSWILANPVQFLKIAPAKVFRLWCGDYYANKVLEPATKSPAPLKTIALWSLTYYATLLLALAGIWHERRRLWGMAGVILLPVVLGTGMHLLMYGGMRYHYPLMVPLYYFAAIGALSLAKYQKRLAELKRIA